MHKKLFLAVICLAASGSMKACGSNWFFHSSPDNEMRNCPCPYDTGSRFLLSKTNKEKESSDQDGVTVEDVSISDVAQAIIAQETSAESSEG